MSRAGVTARSRFWCRRTSIGALQRCNAFARASVSGRLRMKSEKPRKTPAPGALLRPGSSPPSKTRARPSYPRDVLSDEAEIEFLRSVADICNARASEVEEAIAARKAK